MFNFPFPIPDNTPFPVSNIPFGIFSTEKQPTPRPGVALGDSILDLQALILNGFQVEESVEKAIFSSSLNAFAALATERRAKFRKEIQSMIQDTGSVLYQQNNNVVWQSDAKMHVPMHIGGFADFMCSLEHVETVGRLAGYGQVPQPFFDMPLGYNGRASSIITSGQDFTRPYGMIPGENGARYSPCQKLDYEMELGIFISNPIDYGETVSALNTPDHIFGFVLMNDWSARDIQFYEMMPLGPFNGKSTATSISPWVITIEAMREAGALISPPMDGSEKPVGGKATPEPFLRCPIDLSLRVSSYLSRDGGHSKEMLGKSDVKHLHWSPFQMIAHHSSSGCGLRTGDLIGTGTLSSTKEQIFKSGDGFDANRRSGCLQELVQGGKHPLRLADGSELTWLEDGDTVIMEGWAGSGDQMIGFGQLSNTSITRAYCLESTSSFAESGLTALEVEVQIQLYTQPPKTAWR
ncbi:hypothetical protein FDECE_4103 [Fusarium decemcellulare]|nr:hypothetical protein FDECE_4103 [Fusarium decemcellulare]